jgi:hypothetical protein
MYSRCRVARFPVCAGGKKARRAGVESCSILRRISFPSLLASILACLLVTPSSGLAADWGTVYESEVLIVERRDYKGSALDEVRGKIRVKASLNAVMALLKDASFNDQWVYRSGGAEVLQESGYAQAYVYGVVDAPWPMTDRDTVVRFDYVQHAQTLAITISISNFPEFIPHKAGLVRVPDFGGFWQLVPVPGGWVDVTYQVYGKPGGWIPVWVANRAAGVSVTNTLLTMPEVIGRYAESRSQAVSELPDSR